MWTLLILLGCSDLSLILVCLVVVSLPDLICFGCVVGLLFWWFNILVLVPNDGLDLAGL